MNKLRSIIFQIHNKINSSGLFLCCLLLCVSMFLTSCSKDGVSDNDDISSEKVVSNVTTLKREWVYVPEVFTVENGSADYERMQPVGDTFYYVSFGEESRNGIKSICQYSLNDGELKSVPINWLEGGNDWDPGYRFFTQDYGLYMTANVYPASGSMKRFLCRFDLEGNCMFSKDITEQAGGNVSIHELTADSQGRIYIFLDNGELLLYTNGGDYHGSISYNSPENQAIVQIKGACKGADGRVYFCIGKESMNMAGSNKEETADVRCTLMEVDFENTRLLEIAGNLPNINGLCMGTGKNEDSAGGSDDLNSGYDLLLYDDRAVYKYNFGTQKNDSGQPGEELFLWMDSDINGYCVTNLYLLEDGRLCATVVDWMNDDRGIVVLERTKAEQAPKREELVLATVDGGSDLATMAVKFNRGNSQYHLTVKSYESLTDLYNAILTKEPMDLIDLSGINVQKLADRGLFEDLTPYVDQSEAFDRSDFVDGILDVYTVDDTLVSIPAEFMIRTIVGNSGQMNNKAGLTLDELYLIENRNPGVKAFDGVTKEEILQYLMMFNEDTFIDWDTGSCHFDTEEFKALLEYVSQFPDSVASGREDESLSSKINKGEVLFAIAELYPSMLRDYVKIFGGDAACVGFPTADGKGGHLLISSDAYAIASVSEHKESAWQFIEEILTQEKKGELYVELWFTYPALKKKLNEKAEFAIEKDEVTWDDVNMVLELVSDATPFFSVGNDEIIKIINEEAGAYYSGQKGIDDVVSLIQNRIQLYVNENN